jgi:hypothetical protein
MPLLCRCFLIILCAFILFSCSNKKQKKTTTNNTSSPVLDTANVMTSETSLLLAYSNSFTKNYTQTFTAAPLKVSVITGKKGLRVTVNPTVLEKEDGTTIDGNITIIMIELTSSEDLFKANAATISNGKLLVSGGSYFIGMECNGQKLKIKKGGCLKIEFPKLKNSEMELFYGNRDTTGLMNWIKAEQPLAFNTYKNYTTYNPPYPDTADFKPYYSEYHLYDSLGSKVIFNGKQITVKEMVDILQKRGIDKNIDTVYISWRSMQLRSCFGEDYKWENMAQKKYRIISCKELKAEKDSIAKENKIHRQHDMANKEYDKEWERMNEENSLTGQLQKYYAPSAVTKLGWINCDRFYDSPQNTEIPVELPITLNNSVIEYFIIYKSFNGLVSGKLCKDLSKQYVLSKLPEGQAVTLIAFAKNNNQLFHCKQDFVIQKNKTIKLNFKNITAEEMSKMFGKNVKT